MEEESKTIFPRMNPISKKLQQDKTKQMRATDSNSTSAKPGTNDRSQIICVVRFMKEKTVTDVLRSYGTIIENLEDALRFLALNFSWFDRNKVLDTHSIDSCQFMIRCSHIDQLCVFVYNIEPDKIYLLLRGVVGELCEEGEILVRNSRVYSLISFVTHVFSYSNSKISDNMSYYYRGKCGLVSEFKTTLIDRARLKHIYKAIKDKHNTPLTEKQEKLDTATVKRKLEKPKSITINLSQTPKTYEAMKDKQDNTSDKSDEYEPLLNTTDTESYPRQTYPLSSQNLRRRPVHKSRSLNNDSLMDPGIGYGCIKQKQS